MKDNNFTRLLTLPKNRSFFLFGPRNTGKSTLLETVFNPLKATWFDLLDVDLQMRLKQHPNDLFHMVNAIPENKPYVVIDEIQKIPELLDVVHRLMKNKNRIFILSGSSARKLKIHGVNLLAGRAFVYHLFPLTHIELADSFNLDLVLQYGSLPEIFLCQDHIERREFLMAYTHTYLKEEIMLEQLIRNLVPFRKFLEVASQCNGKIINYANIARDVLVDEKTVKNYFSILEDTMLAFILEPYSGSIRKRATQKPKFYFCDIGISRALGNLLSVPLLLSTNAYGNVFEHFIIAECIRLNDYLRKDFKFSYLRTSNNVEIDLIIERPGSSTLLIEIKSSKQVNAHMLKHLLSLGNNFSNAKMICLSNDPYAKKFDNVLALPWQQGLNRIFVASDESDVL